MMSPKHYTPFEDVNVILDRLLHDVKEVVGQQFVGMYLFGSLANGGFDEHSDIDVLVVTNGEISETVFSKLQSMHRQIAAMDSPWAMQLEVSYIPQNALRRFEPANKTHPHLDRGQGEQLHMMAHESDWIIQRHLLYERAIPLEGPNPQTLIDPVSRNDLRRGVVDVFPLWANPILEDPFPQLKNRGYQSFIVLSLCRMLYTLQNGAILPKLEAAEWAMKTLGGEWTALIERAIDGRQNPGLKADPEDINGTLAFLRFVRSCVEQSKV